MDCNDHAPEFLATEYQGRIFEGVAPGSSVTSDLRGPLVLQASDQDSALLQYDILEVGPRRLFYIDSSTGKFSYAFSFNNTIQKFIF